MALPNLSGSNIQDTFQRVLHTDGTSITDGTGSEVLSATELASLKTIDTNAIANADWTYMSTMDQHVNSTGSVNFNRVTTTNAISADGNISSSRDIHAGQYFSNGEGIAHDNGITTFYGNTKLTEIVGSNITLDAPVTASGNISASAFIYADTFIAATAVRTDVLKPKTSAAFGITLDGNITASGDISASGIIIGNELRAATSIVGQIGTYNQPNITSVGTLTNINTSGNITASGNISASGYLYGSNATIGNTIYLGGENRIDYNNDDIRFQDTGIDVAGNITASGNISASGYLRGTSGQFGDSPVLAGPIRDLEVRNEGSTYLRLESVGNGNQVIEFRNDQEPDFYIQNKFDKGGLIIASDNKQFIIIGADDGDVVEISGSLNVTGTNGHITASGNISCSGNLYFNEINGGTF